jgi:hypothetical protein
MKKTFLLIAVLALMASCEQPGNDAPPSPELALFATLLFVGYIRSG